MPWSSIFNYFEKYISIFFWEYFNEWISLWNCSLIKHHCVPFQINNSLNYFPFSLIHYGVWGLSCITNNSSYQWFVTFIDDCTRSTSDYLLNFKSKVPSIFSIFHNFIQNHFVTKIHTLRTNNRKEYFN